MDELPSTPPKMGAPRKEINWEAFESLCQMHATEEEFCFFFKIDVVTLNTRCKEKYDGRTFSHVYEELKVGGRMSLRRRLWRNAMGDEATYDRDGNKLQEETKPHAATAIFLSKQKQERGGLGFSDKMISEHDIGDGTYEKMMGFCDLMEKEKSEEPK